MMVVMVRSGDKNRSAAFARAWLGAFGFLTVLPSPTWRDGDARRLALGFPWVGLVLGLVLWAAWPWLGRLPSGLVGVASAALWLGLTGFLHFDGLCDCADAALAAQPPDRRRQIARDTRLGSYALAVGGLYLIGLVAVLDTTADARAWIVAPFAARTAIVIPMWLGTPDAES
jgi:adenosylcobinamide-GDP ribazoletransferase